MIEEAVTALISLVNAHYNIPNASPLYLSAVGQNLAREHRETLVSAFGTLGNAVRSASSGQLILISDRERPGRTAVALPSNFTEIENCLSELTQTRASAGGQFTALPRPIQLAFCVATEAGENVAVRLTPPMRYRKLAPEDPIPAGFKLVEARFRIPKLRLDMASSADLDRLWENYLAWANARGVAADHLLRSNSPANALERFLAGQDPEIVKKIVLTGDIAAILLRHS